MVKEITKEVVVEEPHEAKVRETLAPELFGENGVLIQMKPAGAYGSDHHIYHGLNPCSTYPRISGHENVRVVVKAGSAITNVKVGDHVIVDLIPTCGTCCQCRIGRKNVCEHAQVGGSGADGGWKEYLMAPVSEMYKIDDSAGWKDAALVESYAIDAHRIDRARIVPEDVIFILSTGTIGPVTLRIYGVKGYQMVICCGTDDVSLQRAKEYGAGHVISSKTEDVMKRVTGIIHNHGATVAPNSACFPGSLTMYMQPGILYNVGRMVPPGFPTTKEEITQAMISQRELDVISPKVSCFQFEPTIRRMENGEFNTGGIATMFTSFSEIDKVFYYMDHPCTEPKKMVILSDRQRS